MSHQQRTSLLTYSPSFQPFQLPISSSSSTRHHHPTQEVTASGSIIISSSLPTTDIGKLSYYLKCCILGCGMPCTSSQLSFELFDYEHAHARLSMNDQEQLYTLVHLGGDYSLYERVLNHYIIVDTHNILLPRNASNVFINIPREERRLTTTHTHTTKSHSTTSISSLLENIASSSSSSASSSFSVSRLQPVHRQRRGGERFKAGSQVMLCTKEWIQDYYMKPLTRYFQQRLQRLTLLQQQFQYDSVVAAATTTRDSLSSVTSSTTATTTRFHQCSRPSDYCVSDVIAVAEYVPSTSSNDVEAQQEPSAVLPYRQEQRRRGHLSSHEDFVLSELSLYNSGNTATDTGNTCFACDPTSQASVNERNHQSNSETNFKPKKRSRSSCDKSMNTSTYCRGVVHHQLPQSFVEGSDDDYVPLVEAIPLSTSNRNAVTTVRNIRATNKRRKLSPSSPPSSYLSSSGVVTTSIDSSGWLFLPGQEVRIVNLPKAYSSMNGCLGIVKERHTNGKIVVRIENEDGIVLPSMFVEEKRKTKTMKTYMAIQLFVKAKNLIIVMS